jgi:hypothetical protein
VVDCTGLENRQRATVREFESHRFRQKRNPSMERLAYPIGGLAAQCAATLREVGLEFVNTPFTSRRS